MNDLKAYLDTLAARSELIRVIPGTAISFRDFSGNLGVGLITAVEPPKEDEDPTSLKVRLVSGEEIEIWVKDIVSSWNI